MIKQTPEIDKAIPVGHISSGLYIICAQNEENGRIDGFLASWIQQVSFDPLLISLAVKSSRPVYHHITKGLVFTVNVVGDNDNSYVKDFWKGYDPEKNPFERLALKQGKAGGIIFESARSAMECILHSQITPGDHELVIAEVINSYILNENTQSRIHVRESGRTY